MKAIWKYRLSGGPDEICTIPLPDGANIIYAALQDGTPTIWAEVNPEAVLKLRKFIVKGTEWVGSIGDAWIHLGSYIDGPFVWHIYEVCET